MNMKRLKPEVKSSAWIPDINNGGEHENRIIKAGNWVFGL